MQGTRCLRIDASMTDSRMVYDLWVGFWKHYGETKNLDEEYALCRSDGFVLPVGVLQDETAYVRNRYNIFFIELK